MRLENKKIALAVTGSIAAYKAAEITSLLVKEGAEVRVLMTKDAERFIAPLTLKTLSRNAVISDLWDEREDWVPEHIAVAAWADLFLVAPATAHMIACFANGLAPEVISCTYLATRAPVLVAPAMNCNMLDHPATQDNIAKLRARGHIIVEPAAGMLACGYEGRGKLAAPAEIVENVVKLIG